MTLVFVYNAEAGVLHGLADSFHKLVSPETYPCGLCALTYGLATMKPEWRAWLDRLDTPARFFHRADFKAAWPECDVALPAVLVERRGKLFPLVSAGEFAGIKSVDALAALIEEKLAKAEHDDSTL